MNLENMKMFLSEDNIKRHLEHFRTYKLKYSILEKSVPLLRDKSISDLLRMNIDRELKDDAIHLLWQIKSHQLYFSSFSEKPYNGKTNGILYEKLIYDIYSVAKNKEYGFVYLFLDKKGVVCHRFENTPGNAFIKYYPCLAIDIYEHAYILDYGYSYEKYLKSALSYLNIEKLFNNIS